MTMKSNILTNIINMLHDKRYDALYLSISNENLYEFTDIIKNAVHKITGFAGDTGSLLITKKYAYLYVDGRFTIQAKNEIKDKRIKIVEIQTHNKKLDHIKETLKNKSRLAFNPKTISIDRVLKVKDILSKKNITLIADYKFIDSLVDDTYDQTGLFILDKKYVSRSIKQKIKLLIDDISTSGFDYYITSSLEEIAYITNLRKIPKSKSDSMILEDAFMIIGRKKCFLYLKDTFDTKILSSFKRHNVIIKRYNDFYNDLKLYKNKKYD